MSFRIFVPATIGNVASGFDVLGLAVDGLGDRFLFEEKPVYRIEVEGRDASLVPLEAEKNTVTLAAEAFYRFLRVPSRPFRVLLSRSLPLAGGMGSSAASSVAGALAAATFTGAQARSDLILRAALEAEGIVAGRHLDNIAPCFYGGLTLVQDTESLAVFRVPIKLDLWVTLATPAIKIKTSDARRVLPQELKNGAWTKQMAHCTTLALAFACGEVEQLRFGLQDPFAEQARASLIPGFRAAQTAALEAGAYGFSISGSGPTCFALSADRAVAEAVAEKAKLKLGAGTEVYVLKIRHQGAEIFQ